MAASASRRALIGGLAAMPALTIGASAAQWPGPAIVDQSRLAACCLRTVARCAWLDVDGNADDFTEEEWDIELALQNEAFERAITLPSQNLNDLRAKATLALDDLDRFHPEREHRDPGEHLIAVVMREVIALCA